MYSYDANNRITTSTVYGDPTKDIIYDYFSEYEYDKNGNLITEERRYDAMKKGTYELIASDTEYDDRGYDVWGNLTYTHDEDVANDIITYSSMTYYADGMRKSKQSNMRQSGVITNTTYNYYYHGDTVINETRTASGTTSNYATNIIGVTGIEARKQNGTTGFFAKDLHGDVRYAFNSSGTKIADYTYDAWGNKATSSTSTWAQANPLRYNGQYYDQETEMYYLRARYYDPNMNRFISEDPHWNVGNMIYGDNNIYPDNLSIIQSSNLYSYCINNPIKYSDIMGRAIEEYDIYLHENKIMSDQDMKILEVSTRNYANAQIVNDYQTMNMMRRNAVKIRAKYNTSYKDTYDYTHGGITDENGNIFPPKSSTSSNYQTKIGTGLSLDSEYSNDHSDFTVIKDTFDGLLEGIRGTGGNSDTARPTPTPTPYESTPPGMWNDLIDLEYDMNN